MNNFWIQFFFKNLFYNFERNEEIIFLFCKELKEK
jgi:hypothetical protein